MHAHRVKYLFVVSLLTVLSVPALNSCKHDPQPTPLPDPETIQPLRPCDSAKVYFVNDVMPYISSSCAIPGCHTHSDPTAGIDLSSYDEIMKAKVKGKPIVVPGDPLNSKICRVLYLLDLIPMPPILNFQLPQDGKDKIVKWVLQGATNEACEYNGDTTNFTFRRDIRPLINKYCTGCHFGPYAADSIELVSYPQIKLQVDNQKLYESIIGASGVVRMPTGSSVVQPPEVIRIRKWIESGAPFN
jgi:hypothetical protein